MVFPTDDAAGNSIWSCANDHLGFECHWVKGDTSSSFDSFMKEYEVARHDLVIVDCRSSGSATDPQEFARSLRSRKQSQRTVLVAVVKRSLLERDGTDIGPLLASGYDRNLILPDLRNRNPLPGRQESVFVTVGISGQASCCAPVARDTYKLELLPARSRFGNPSNVVTMNPICGRRGLSALSPFLIAQSDWKVLSNSTAPERPLAVLICSPWAPSSPHS
ncbi:unnamed protein product [Notodromas monacha]|uniref:PDE8-like REC N-terminal domain-containing protein n=1 Tax=Notodromas monacha TaxID=399045 RepID=A0A7R9BCQ7_9CRUS|nr:unnamed protein product [Notodromas monacha]CAG0912263.1 unnamed protein product [Notodromas monacha]